MDDGSGVRVNVPLNADLVRQARALTADLPDTVERLLAKYVEDQRAKRAADQAALDDEIAWLNERFEAHGLAGADFSPL